MVSVLSRIFGLAKLDMIEDAVQDSMIAAMQKWPFSGMPDNPRAWLIEVAKNRILDSIRHTARLQSGDDEIENAERSLQVIAETEPVYLAGEISDDQLRMIFACCHPEIRADSQVALTLKIVGGFSVAEIARAFLAKDESVAKLLTRARNKLRAGQIELDIPDHDKIGPRLDAVMKVLYLMFNEGYGASDGDELIRKDLCHEAIRLSRSLANHPLTDLPRVHALTALFLFQAARLPSRSDIHGDLLLLSQQDRGLWDKQMLDDALRHFARSASGDMVTDYHLEAEIAAHHALADDFGSTRWPQILKCYDTLQTRKFSPVVELNRIVVLAKMNGAGAGLERLTWLQKNHDIVAYNLFHITKAHFLTEIGDPEGAIDSYKTALSLTNNSSVRRFLDRKVKSLTSPS